MSGSIFSFRKQSPMPAIQLHYDGWLSLPADARKHLDVATGDRLEIEFTQSGLLLRPAKQAKGAAAPDPEVVLAQPAAAPAEPPAPVEAERAAVKHGPSQPRKPVTQELAPRIKVGGRRKSTQVLSN
ncbi:AbrB/MazE/SpoVT family DNA-binding domain-containing protein [Geminicoccus harenae]|uniref:AbrB/MazE/SpoVT family DNA-binding domain-containing protein n=1 Tax=Geminicoccus harenae TaxID=2498453 RepID=UPI00168C00AF|nr:AbrB/MazE/SpoVT family DNA-binding domain-containing protein [Geminicoccus harenae]